MLTGQAPLLTLTGVVVEFQDGADSKVRPLDGVNLAVGAGQIVAVIGSSGSGKSTLLDFATGMLDSTAAMTSGAVHLLGQDLRTPSDFSSARRSTLGYIAQDGNLLPFLSAFENVALPRILNASTSPLDLDPSEALAVVGLDGLGGRIPHELSGGQRQRVALARALCGGSQLFVLDEPTASLDSETSESLMSVMGCFAERGVGVLMATHDPICMAASTHIFALEDGELAERLAATI